MTDAKERVPRGREYFLDDEDENAGVSWRDFRIAVSVWAWMRPGDQASVRDAAEEFGVTDDVIRKAIAEHYWMYVDGESDDPKMQIIGHDGD